MGSLCQKTEAEQFAECVDRMCDGAVDFSWITKDDIRPEWISEGKLIAAAIGWLIRKLSANYERFIQNYWNLKEYFNLPDDYVDTNPAAIMAVLADCRGDKPLLLLFKLGVTARTMCTMLLRGHLRDTCYLSSIGSIFGIREPFGTWEDPALAEQWELICGCCYSPSVMPTAPTPHDRDLIEGFIRQGYVDKALKTIDLNTPPAREALVEWAVTLSIAWGWGLTGTLVRRYGVSRDAFLRSANANNVADTDGQLCGALEKYYGAASPAGARAKLE